MDSKGQQRAYVLNEVNRGQFQAAEAAEVLGVSERQVWRLLAAYRKEGVASLVHGNSGRQPERTTELGVKELVVELAQE